MTKQTLEFKFGNVPIITNKSRSKKLLLYMHGLDGSAAFSKPLFKNIEKYKIVAMESRGHDNSPLKASRSMKKHLRDYTAVIKNYKAKGYKVWVLGESMGAAYATLLAYQTEGLIEGVFAQSIPNKLENIMIAPKRKQIWIQFMTVLGFVTNINYKYTATVNYEKLSNSRVLKRLARIADKNKKRQVRESLATWAVTKKAWRLIKRKTPNVKLFYFQPGDDVLVDLIKAQKAFGKNKKNFEYIVLKKAKHILMYEREFKEVLSIIHQEMK